jgi:hypothetical protein
MIKSFVERFHQDNDVKKILAGWWVEDKIFYPKSDGLYTMTTLRDPYIYVFDLTCILYGEANYIHFRDAWVPVVHTIIPTR